MNVLFEDFHFNLFGGVGCQFHLFVIILKLKLQSLLMIHSSCGVGEATSDHQ